MICHDVFIKIAEWLSDREKLSLTTVSKLFGELKYKFIYGTKMRIEDIMLLPYFHNFESVEIYHKKNTLPKRVKYVYFKAHGTNIPSSICPPWIFDKTIIPPMATHLTFDDDFNESVDNCIPDSVTHLTFGCSFNRSIINCIPKSITHLTFGRDFNQAITCCIPSSVTHLTFGRVFNQSISDCIPGSVTHLTFGNRFNQPIENLPTSITHLRFGYYFNQPIDDKIPRSVTHLRFGYCFVQKINQVPDSIIEIVVDNSYYWILKNSIMSQIKRVNS